MCSVDQCARPAVARGMCIMHYKRWHRRNPESIFDWQRSIQERFWECVEVRPSQCWSWRGTLSNGYGRLGDGRHNLIPAHRISYEIHKGPIPEGLEVDHTCRNRQCTNPDHLEAVTQRINILRGESIVAHNARKTHCPKGHEYIAENTIVTKDGTRRCRACRREAQRKWQVARPDQSSVGTAENGN